MLWNNKRDFLVFVTFFPSIPLSASISSTPAPLSRQGRHHQRQGGTYRLPGTISTTTLTPLAPAKAASWGSALQLLRQSRKDAGNSKSSVQVRSQHRAPAAHTRKRRLHIVPEGSLPALSQTCLPYGKPAEPSGTWHALGKSQHVPWMSDTHS